MRLSKKIRSNLVFIVLLAGILFPTTRVYFIRWFSFGPSVIEQNERKQLTNFNWGLKGLNVPDVKGGNLSDKPVFISFWATWCPPCVAELPSIKELYSDYKDEITFIFVSNESWKNIQLFYEKNKYLFPSYHFEGELPDEFKTNSIPTTFILNKKGEIVVKKNGPANWNHPDIRELLNELRNE